MDPQDLDHVQGGSPDKENSTNQHPSPYENMSLANSPWQKQKQAAAVQKTSTTDDLLIEQLIPDHKLPVDPERLRKAIKNALIKNNNNPDKIDIQTIMRE